MSTWESEMTPKEWQAIRKYTETTINKQQDIREKLLKRIWEIKNGRK